MDFFRAAVAPFGRWLTWHEGTNKTKSYLDCLVLSPERIPHSFVVSQGSILGGNGRSWSAPVYIIGGQFLDGFPPDEEPVPNDGNPHPLHGHVIHMNPDVPPHWVHDIAAGAGIVLGDVGVNQPQANDAMQELNIQEEQNLQNLNAQQNNGWDAWDAAADNLGFINAHIQPLDDQQEVPQQPAQDSVDLTGSTANFIRGSGSAIHLSVEQVLQGGFGSHTSSSSTEEVSSQMPIASFEPSLQKLVIPEVIRSLLTYPLRPMSAHTFCQMEG
jgi:hypothetical protein